MAKSARLKLARDDDGNVISPGIFVSDPFDNCPQDATESTPGFLTEWTLDTTADPPTLTIRTPQGDVVYLPPDNWEPDCGSKWFLDSAPDMMCAGPCVCVAAICDERGDVIEITCPNFDCGIPKDWLVEAHNVFGDDCNNPTIMNIAQIALICNSPYTVTITKMIFTQWVGRRAWEFDWNPANRYELREVPEHLASDFIWTSTHSYIVISISISASCGSATSTASVNILSHFENGANDIAYSLNATVSRDIGEDDEYCSALALSDPGVTATALV